MLVVFDIVFYLLLSELPTFAKIWDLVQTADSKTVYRLRATMGGDRSLPVTSLLASRWHDSEGIPEYIFTFGCGITRGPDNLLCQATPA